MRVSVFTTLERWFERGIGLFSQSCGVVERRLGRLTEPVVDELRTLSGDLVRLAAGPPAAANDGLSQPSVGRWDLRRVGPIFTGSEHRRQLGELQGEVTAQSSSEEKEATRQLIVGTITVAVNVLAASAHPVLFVVGAAGLLYQLHFLVGQAQRTLAKERRLGIYGLNLLVLSGALVSGSIAALSLGVFSGSFLRYLLAKKEGQAQQSISAVFAQQQRGMFIVAGETELEVPFEQLRTGDIVVLIGGQIVPVDGVVLRGTASIDQRALTGESMPVDKAAGDRVLASSVVLQGRLHVRVELSGADTVAAQAARTLADISDYQRELAGRAEQQQDRLAIPVLALAAIALPIWGFDSALAVLWTMPGQRMLFLGPLTLLSFMQAAAHKGILLKTGHAFERLHEVDTVIFDKTGTLTLDQPSVGRVFPFAEVSAAELLSLAAAAELGQTHPIARAIQQATPDSASLASVAQTLQAADVAIGRGVSSIIAGEQVHIGSHRLMTEFAVAMPPQAHAVQQEVHALGHSLCFLARGQSLVGAIELRPQVRPEAAALVGELHRRGKQVLVLSGDDESPTHSLATQLGISSYSANVLPEGKAHLIEQLQQEGRVVCYVGDGINDSLALKRADVSVSIKGASAIATNSAGVVLMGGDLEELIPLFDMAARFAHYMRVNRVSSNLPAFAILAGTMIFGWSLLTSVVLSQLTLPLAFYGLLLSAVEHQRPADKSHRS